MICVQQQDERERPSSTADVTEQAAGEDEEHGAVDEQHGDAEVGDDDEMDDMVVQDVETDGLVHDQAPTDDAELTSDVMLADDDGAEAQQDDDVGDEETNAEEELDDQLTAVDDVQVPADDIDDSAGMERCRFGKRTVPPQTFPPTLFG